MTSVYLCRAVEMSWAEHVDGIHKMYHAESKQCATPLLLLFFYEQSQTEGLEVCLNRLNYSNTFLVSLFPLRRACMGALLVAIVL